MTESTPEQTIEPIAESVDSGAVEVDVETGAVTESGDADSVADAIEETASEAVSEPEQVPEEVPDLPGDTAGSPPVMPAPAIEESAPMAGAEKQVEDTAGGAAKDVAPKSDKKPNRKLGWRAYILGGSGGTK